MSASPGAPRTFGRRVLTLVGGTLGSQLVLLAVVPVVTRLYSPDELGLHALFAALLFVLVALANARYEYAIPLVDDDAEAGALLRLCAILAVATAALTALATALGATALASALQTPALAPWLVWLAPAVLAGGLFQALNYALVRRQAFGVIAAGRVAQALGTGATWVASGLLGLVPGGLFVGEVVGRWLSVAVCGGARHLRRPAPAADARAIPLREVARRQRRYPLFVLPATLLNLLSVQLPPLLLAIFFGSAVVGWFALAVRILQAPIRVLGHAVGQVFMAGLAQRDDAAIALATTATLRRLTRMSLTGGALLMLVAPQLVAVVFGAAWREAGEYARMLAPWLVLVFIASPLTSLVLARGRQRAELIFQGVLLAARLAALLAGGWLGRAEVAVALFAAVSTLAWVVYLFALLGLGGVPLGRALRLLAPELAIALVAATPAALAAWLAAPVPVFVAALALLGAAWAVQLVRALRASPAPVPPAPPAPTA